MKIKTPKQFLAAGAELLECHRVCGDPVHPEEGKRAHDRAVELEKAMAASPFVYNDNEEVVIHYRIHITPTYCFRFEGILPWWKQIVIRLIGWKITVIS